MSADAPLSSSWPSYLQARGTTPCSTGWSPSPTPFICLSNLRWETLTQTQFTLANLRDSSRLCDKRVRGGKRLLLFSVWSPFCCQTAAKHLLLRLATTSSTSHSPDSVSGSLATLSPGPRPYSALVECRRTCSGRPRSLGSLALIDSRDPR